MLGAVGLTRTSVDIAPGLEPHTAVRYDTDGSRIPFYVCAPPAGILLSFRLRSVVEETNAWQPVQSCDCQPVF